jgi:hypothetical protein
MRTAALLVVLPLTSVGCLPPLEPVAAVNLPCDEDKIETEQIGFAQSAKGCGREDIYLYDGNLGKWVSLLERAAFEFSCEKSEIKITTLDSVTFGVQGCDKRAVYKVDWMHGFVMNSSSDPEAGKATRPKNAEPEEEDKPGAGKSL